MANHVTTEWEDAQVKLGNYVRTEEILPSLDELQKKALNKIEKVNPLEKKTMEQLEELDDDEDEEIKKYEAKRLKEMKEFASKPHFGTYLELKRQDYIKEVTNAPKGVFVVLHLYQDYIQESNLLDIIFKSLSVKNPLVKFMRIKSNECIETFPESQVPGVIVVKDSKVYCQFIPAVIYFGGKGHVTESKVEWALDSKGIIKKESEYNPFLNDEEELENKLTEEGRRREHKEVESDSDDDDDGRGTKKYKEYGFKILRK